MSISDRMQRMDTAKAAGVLALGALAVLALLRTGFGGIAVRLGD